MSPPAPSAVQRFQLVASNVHIHWRRNGLKLFEGWRMGVEMGTCIGACDGMCFGDCLVACSCFHRPQ